MKTKKPLEDNWHDIVTKAMRGLRLDISLLAERSQLSEVSVRALVEQTLFNKQTLIAIAPVLHLNAQALLSIALNPYYKTIPELPKNFQCFTTSYYGMAVHSYLLWSHETKQAVAFDTGADLAPLLQQFRENELELSAILLTHGHSDHIIQLRNLIDHSKAPAWIHEYDLIPAAAPLPDNYRYQLDKTISIEAHLTPGHSPGGTTYIIHGISPTIAVVGDALFAGSVGGIPPSSYEAALKAIQKNILSLSDGTILCPGHGPLTTVGQEKVSNPFFASI